MHSRRIAGRLCAFQEVVCVPCWLEETGLEHAAHGDDVRIHGKVDVRGCVCLGGWPAPVGVQQDGAESGVAALQGLKP